MRGINKDRDKRDNTNAKYEIFRENYYSFEILQYACVCVYVPHQSHFTTSELSG